MRRHVPPGIVIGSDSPEEAIGRLERERERAALRTQAEGLEMDIAILKKAAACVAQKAE